MLNCKLSNKEHLTEDISSLATSIKSTRDVDFSIQEKGETISVEFFGNDATNASEMLYDTFEKSYPDVAYLIKNEFNLPVDEASQTNMKSNYKPQNVKLYQLHKDNATRNIALEKKLQELLIDLDFKIMSIDEYKKDYELRTGDGIDPIALADLTASIVAWSQDKAGGETLAEEAGHILESSLRFNNENSWRKLMYMKDSTGKLYLESTPQWKQHYREYLDKYDQNQEMAKREIIGKIMGAFIANKFVEDTNTPIANLYKRIVEKIKRWFGKIDITHIPDAVAEIYENEVANFFDGQTIKPVENVRFDVATNHKSEIAGVNSNALKVLKHRLKKLKTEKNRLSGTNKALYKKLKGQYNIEEIQDLIDAINSKSQKSDKDLEALNDLYDLRKLDKMSAKDKRDVDKIKNIEERIIGLEHQILFKTEHEALHAMIMGSEDVSGLSSEITQALNDIDKIKKGELELTNDIFIDLLEFTEYYVPTVEKLKGFNIADGVLDIPDNKEFFEEVNKLHAKLSDVKVFLQAKIKPQLAETFDNMNTLSDGTKLNPDFSGEDAVKDNNFWDIGVIAKYTMFGQHINNPVIQSTIQKISEIHNKVHNFTVGKGKEISENLKGKVDYIMESSDDSPTGYLINKYKLGGQDGFLAQQKEAFENIIHDVERYASSLGDPITISIDDAELRKSILEGHDLIKMDLSPKDRVKKLETRKRISKKYRNLVYNWTVNNRDEISVKTPKDFKKTKNFKELLEAEIMQKYLRGAKKTKNYTPPQDSVLYLISNRFETLSEPEFNEWFKMNIRYNHSEQPFVVGELSVPSSKYLNDDFANLTAEQREKVNYYQKQLIEAKQKLPSFYRFAYADRYLLPQISESTVDLLFSEKKSFSDFNERARAIFGGIIKPKQDDTLYATDHGLVNADSTIYKNAPIRFNSPLDNPKTLSRDVASSLIAYHEMAEKFKQSNLHLNDFSMMEKGLATLDLKKKNFNSIHNVKGSESNTMDMFKELLNIHVFEESAKDNSFKLLYHEIDGNKLAHKVQNWVRKKNLFGNFSALITGVLQLTKELGVETILGRTINKGSIKFAMNELLKNIGQVTRDLGKNVKSNKISLFVDKIGLYSTQDRYDNLDKSRFVRLITGASDYGLWKLMDFAPKATAFLAVADNYRLINGNWYTKNQYKENDWDAHKESSFYNLLEIKDGELTNDVIGEEQWNFIRKRSKGLASNLDTQPGEIDKNLFSRTIVGGFASIHRGWIFQGIQRKAKGEHFNTYTQQTEKGYYRSTGRFLKDLFSSGHNIFDLRGQVNRFKSLPPAEKEGVLRTVLDLGFVYSVYLLSFVLNGIANDDDDDPMLQLAAYVSTRLVVENLAFFSGREMFDVIQRPVAGSDSLDDITTILNSMLDLMAIWDDTESEVIRSGPYKGKSRAQKALIKSTPYVRGYYETFPVETGLNNPTVALKGKNRYIKNQVLNEFSLLDPFITPVQLFVGHLKNAGKD